MEDRDVNEAKTEQILVYHIYIVFFSRYKCGYKYWSGVEFVIIFIKIDYNSIRFGYEGCV